MRIIDTHNLENIAMGAAVLGTGGGGDPFVGKMMAKAAIEKYGPVTLLSPDEIGDEDWVVSAALGGAPSVLIEKIPSGSEVIGAFDAIRAYSKKNIKAIVPSEVGGVNSIVPLMLGAMTGIPVVDIDGMGRAFPEAQMVTFHLAGLQSAPMSMADEKGNTLIINGSDSIWNERISRAALIAMGGSVMFCDFLMQGRDLKAAGIHHTLTLAEKIGETVHGLRHRNENPIAAMVDVLGGKMLFEGKINNLLRRTSGGFTRGEVYFDGINLYQGKQAKIAFQNEFLLAEVDGQVAVTTPDLIAILDLETGFPITTEALRYGNRVAIIAMPCDAKWRTEKGIQTAGPRYFGYGIDYTPLTV
ncbi:DUF917 domain-containing protein [Brevibacillus fluminis]|uniref:DUF917 domain-containing protein n=1 Tax=Brevibacillus fluminis TaxID=511487 RepID=A0A3M8CZH8_9BACL|nr:DUF917 domain-containing protein [Brevibacillus fluminis]RNB81210.1 DUF917 domain-containing protein [Brevibacillus fluminis]